MATQLDLNILKGDTFSPVIRWEKPPYVYKAISAVLARAPLRLTVAGHGLRSDWRAAIVSMLGMTQANAAATPPADEDYRTVTVVDDDTVEFNAVNAAGFSNYTSGGFLQYFTPADMAGYTARMQVKDRVGGAVLLSLTTENGGIALDNTNHTITLLLTAAQTAAITWKKGVYDLEMVSPDVVPIVTKLYTGMVIASYEVTT
jgi:hypothetical protein